MQTWAQIISKVSSMQPHEKLKVDKSKIRHPAFSGFVRSVGSLNGQLADWEKTLPDGRRIHVVEFEDHYLVHWDRVSPLVDPVEHLKKDDPKFYFLFKLSSIILKLMNK